MMFFSQKLEKFNNLKHCFFTKNNGFSDGLYKSLNCGIGSRDKISNVRKNLNYVANFMEVKSENLILMNQTHSNKVILFEPSGKNENIRVNADAIITKSKNFAIGVLTADCIPIIFFDQVNNIVGCVHAGWKGAFSGIIENLVSKLISINKEFKITASVGPCIHQKSYEVDNNFFKKFINDDKENELLFKKISTEKFLFDLRGYVNKKLKYNGIIDVDNIDMDTFSDDKNFFSYRRSLKLGESDYGRCMSAIKLL